MGTDRDDGGTGRAACLFVSVADRVAYSPVLCQSQSSRAVCQRGGDLALDGGQSDDGIDRGSGDGDLFRDGGDFGALRAPQAFVFCLFVAVALFALVG